MSLTLFHLGSGMTLSTGGGSKSTGGVYGLISWPRDYLVPKTCSRINILVFSIPQTPKTALYVGYFCGYRLSNDEGQKSNFSSQKRPKFQILSYRSHIYLKRKLRTCTIKIQPEKVGFLAKNQIFFRFSNFSPNARGPPKIFDVQFCEILKNKFQKWLLWDLSGIERNKVKNFGEPSPCPSETAEGFMVVRCFLTPPS